MTFFDPLNLPQLQPLKNVSASQVKNFTLCERKWVMEGLYRLRAPPATHLVLGTELHKHLEEWLLKGTPPPSKLATAALEWLPARGSGMMAVEKGLTEPVLMSGDMPWKGFIDLLYQPHGVINMVKVFDHKTTTNMSWAKSSKDLVEDIQMMTYAKWAIDADAAIEKVELQHTYMVTSSSNKTDAVHAVVTRKEIEDFWPALDTRAKEMSQLAKVLQDVPNAWEQALPNWDSCGAFGGCPFRGVLCKRNKNNGGSIFSEINSTNLNQPGNKMSLADIIAAKKASAASATNGAIVAKAVLQQTPTKQPVISILPPDAPVQNKETTAAKMAAEVARVEDLTATKAAEKVAAKTSKLKIKDAPQSVTVSAAVMPVTIAAKAEIVTYVPEEKPAMVAIKEKFILCLHCFPMTVSKSVPLEIIIASLTEKISKQTGTLWQAMDYAKKTSTLSEALKSEPLLEECYTFNTSDALQESVIVSVLVKRALHIFRGSK